MSKSDDMNFLLLALLVSLAVSALPLAETFSEKNSKRFGADLDDATPKIQLNKYYNYVHLQPEWNSYPSNMLFDVTVFWNKTHSDNAETQAFGGAKNKINDLQYIGAKSYVEVQYDYVDCNYQWIHYARYGFDVWNANVDYWSGKQMASGVDSASFSKIPSAVQTGVDSLPFLQFIPVCTSDDVTSFEYGIRADDRNLGFDVYFVPSEDERLNYLNGSDFQFYGDDGCFGLGYRSFSGKCNDVGKDSGLLIVIPDMLEKPLTKISIKLKEI